MPFRFLPALIFLLLAQAAGRAETAPRVVILPLAADVVTDKEDGSAVTAYIQSQMGDSPGVIWVERAELDKLLAETHFRLSPAGDASAVAIGRLLKADLLIRGRYSRAGWEKTESGALVYRRHLFFEVTDLTNASLLASQDMPFDDDPRRERKGLNPLILERCAEMARNLLTDALKARARAAAGITLAPLFFANSGASPRLDAWESLLVEKLAVVSGSFPGTTVLRFRGAGEALREQGLSLLGLTDADPGVWQTAATGYIWGSYHELAPNKMTVFEDIQVETELFLVMGGKEPRRFTRAFAVKDFEKESGALVADVLRAAVASRNTTAAPESGRQMAAAIFDHLCDWINAGFFTKKPDLPETVTRAFRQVDHSKSVVRPVMEQPFGDRRSNTAGACWRSPVFSILKTPGCNCSGRCSTRDARRERRRTIDLSWPPSASPNSSVSRKILTMIRRSSSPERITS